MTKYLNAHSDSHTTGRFSIKCFHVQSHYNHADPDHYPIKNSWERDDGNRGNLSNLSVFLTLLSSISRPVAVAKILIVDVLCSRILSLSPGSTTLLSFHSSALVLMDIVSKAKQIYFVYSICSIQACNVCSGGGGGGVVDKKEKDNDTKSDGKDFIINVIIPSTFFTPSLLVFY